MSKKVLSKKDKMDALYDQYKNGSLLCKEYVSLAVDLMSKEDHVSYYAFAISKAERTAYHNHRAWDILAFHETLIGIQRAYFNIKEWLYSDDTGQQYLEIDDISSFCYGEDKRRIYNFSNGYSTSSFCPGSMPICKRYMRPEPVACMPDCLESCPIRKKTGKDWCGNTPYVELRRLLYVVQDGQHLITGRRRAILSKLNEFYLLIADGLKSTTKEMSEVNMNVKPHPVFIREKVLPPINTAEGLK